MQLQSFFLSVPTTDSHGRRYLDRVRRVCGDACLSRLVPNIPSPHLNLDKLLTLSDIASKAQENGQALITKMEAELFKIYGSSYRPKIKTSRESVSWYEYCLHFTINEKILGLKKQTDEESSKFEETSLIEMSVNDNQGDGINDDSGKDNYMYSFFENAQKSFNETAREMNMLAQQIREIDHQINQKKRMIGGGLPIKPLDDVLNNENCFDIAFVRTLLFVIPTNMEEEFLANYEYLGRTDISPEIKKGKKSLAQKQTKQLSVDESEMPKDDEFFGVIPSTALKIVVEDQYILYSVVVAKKDVDVVVAAARERKWIVRTDVITASNENQEEMQPTNDISAAAMLGVYGIDEIEAENTCGAALVSQVVRELIEKEKENQRLNEGEDVEVHGTTIDTEQEAKNNFAQVDMEENDKENFNEHGQNGESHLEQHIRELQETLEQKKKMFGQWLSVASGNALIYFMHVSSLKAYIEGTLRFGEDIDVILAVCPEKATFVYESGSGKYGFATAVDSHDIKNAYNGEGSNSFNLRLKAAKDGFNESFEDLATRVLENIQKQQTMLMRTVLKDKNNKKQKMDVVSEIVFDKNIDAPNAFLPFVYVPCILEAYGISYIKQLEKSEKLKH